jgi:hypothetical protein
VNFNPQEKMMSKEIGVVITTAHRGVFFGYIPKLTSDKSIMVKKVRMAVYWSADVRGVLGLAASGPVSGCRITPAVDEMAINDVTSVMKCTEDAVKAWEKQVWS